MLDDNPQDREPPNLAVFKDPHTYIGIFLALLLLQGTLGAYESLASILESGGEPDLDALGSLVLHLFVFFLLTLFVAVSVVANIVKRWGPAVAESPPGGEKPRTGVAETLPLPWVNLGAGLVYLLYGVLIAGITENVFAVQAVVAATVAAMIGLKRMKTAAETARQKAETSPTLQKAQSRFSERYSGSPRDNVLARPENLFAVLILIFFFVPWVNLGPITFSGYEIPQLVDSLVGLKSFGQGYRDANLEAAVGLFYLLYLIPILALAAIIFTLYGVGNRTLSKIAGWSAIGAGILPLIALMIVLFAVGGDLFSALSLGAYLLILSGIALVLSAFGLIKPPPAFAQQRQPPGPVE